MKTARELFEKLGYTCEKNDGEIISYKYYINDRKAYTREIDFYIDFQYYCTKHALGRLTIGVELHKAITKQMEELGWLK